MRISKIHIENLRSIKSLSLAPALLCCLVGPSNAGKSNILLAIQRVLGRDWVSVTSFDELDVHLHQWDCDVVIEVSFEPAIEYRRFKEADPTSVRTLSYAYTRYKRGQDKGKRRLEQKCLDDRGQTTKILAKAPKLGTTHDYQPLINIPSDVREAVPLIYIGTNRFLREQLPAARYPGCRPAFRISWLQRSEYKQP